MKVVLTLEKVKDVLLFGLEQYNPRSVSLLVHYYNNEPCFEYSKNLIDLSESRKKTL